MNLLVLSTSLLSYLHSDKLFNFFAPHLAYMLMPFLYLSNKTKGHSHGSSLGLGRLVARVNKFICREGSLYVSC